MLSCLKTDGGERGIRTLGTVLAVHAISSRAPSTARTSLRVDYQLTYEIINAKVIITVLIQVVNIAGLETAGPGKPAPTSLENDLPFQCVIPTAGGMVERFDDDLVRVKKN